MAAARVLIVEDNTPLAENLAEILEGRGVETRIASNVEEATGFVDVERFDGIITDLRLPGISGAEFIATLRARGDAVPIVVVTAYADESAVARVEGLGALEVLSKPVDVGRLFSAVSEFARETDRVLVLEDSDELADNVADVLRERNFEPIVSATIEGALAQRHLPRVAVVDLRLPDGSGLEAIRKLVARDPSIRVLLTTAYAADLEDDDATLECIERPILEKPVRMEVLAERVEAAARCTTPKRSS